MAEKFITVAIAGAHGLHRDGLGCLIARHPDLRVVGEGGDGFAAVELARKVRPAVLVLAAPLPGRDSLDVTRDVVSLDNGTRVLALAGPAAEGYARRVLRAGAHGFLPTTSRAAELIAAIHRVHRGQIYLPGELQRSFAERYLRTGTNGTKEDHLSDREFQVMCLLASGATNREIADKLCIGIKTVDTHRSRVLKKLGLRNNADIARFAIEKQCITL